MSQPGVHELVRRARADDQEAWRALYDLLRPYLLRQAQTLLGPNWRHHSARDLLHDTWARACRAFGRFRGGDGDDSTLAALRVWLRRIMHNAYRNQVRKDDRSPTATTPLGPPGADGPGLDPAAPDASVSRDLRAEERRRRVEQALAALDPTDREVLRLSFFADEKLSLQKIAVHLGLSYDRVRARYHAALKRLGPRLQDLL